MSAHALLSPSSASRWLSCPPSARLEDKYPNSTSEAAAEGTLAHSLGELYLLKYLGDIPKKDYDRILSEIKASQYYNEAMEGYIASYVAYVVETYEAAKAIDPTTVMATELKLDLTAYVPEAFGTGDVVIVSDGTLHIIDLKYGKGVRVECTGNKQMRLYALGALRDYDYLYPIDTVVMHVFQPRMDNIDTDTLAVIDLQAWAENVLKPTALLAFEGKGEFSTGDHCRFCRAKAQCKALADENLKLAAYDFQEGFLLSDEEISDILTRAAAFKNWISAIEEFALSAAINEGKKWPGYKLVEGRSNRLITDQQAAIKKLEYNGYGEDVYLVKKLAGITDLEKNLGKMIFSKVLGELVIKPAGKPTLVIEADKRPEWSSVASAVCDFTAPENQ